MAVLRWIVSFLYRLVVVPVDVLLGRRRKAYQARIGINAPRAAVWAHLIADKIAYDGVVPYEVSQRRRPGQPGMIDAKITLGETELNMVLREIENDGHARISTEVLREGTDDALYLGDDYRITTDIAPAGDADGCYLTLTYEVTHTTLGGRFNLPLSVDPALQRIKTHIEKAEGTAVAPARNAPWRDALITGVLTLGSFAILFDLTFAAKLVGVLLLHELGHVLAMRWIGLPVKGIYFVPFMGAVAVGQSGFSTEARRGFIALMGPAASMLTTLVFLYLYVSSGDRLWRDLALVSIILNGFNLLPVLPLDGGQILSALMSRAPFIAQRVVQLGLLAAAAVVALRLEAYVTLTFIGIVSLVLAMQKPALIRLQPIGVQAGFPLLVAYLATFAFYVGAGLWLFQLGRN